MEKMTSFDDIPDIVPGEVPSNEKDTADYLDITALDIGMTYSRICLVSNVSAGVDKTGNEFITFYVKDKNACSVACRWFKVTDFHDKAVYIRGLMNKPVRISFRADVFANNITLVLNGEVGIKVLSENEFDRDMFVGKVKVDYDSIRSLNNYADPNEDVVGSFKGLSTPSIYGGKVDGFLKLYDIVLSSCVSMQDAGPLNIQWLAMCAHVSLIQLFFKLKDTENSRMIANDNILDRIYSVKMKYKDHPASPYITDSVFSIIGDRKPEYIYSILVTRFISRALEDAETVQEYIRMSLGFSIATKGGEVLSKRSI